MSEKLLLGESQYDRRQHERKPWHPKRREEDERTRSCGHISAKEEELWTRLDAQIARIQTERDSVSD